MSPTTPKGPETPKHRMVSRSLASDGGRSPTPNFDSPRRPPTTLTSSLSIPVHGALPISRPNHADKDGKGSQLAAGTARDLQSSSTRRAPRKSKTDALVALRNHSSTSPDLAGDLFMDDLDILEPPFPSTPLPAPENLDLSSVKTKTPRLSGKSRSRPFSLPECPTFYPSPEEFSDPTMYIQSIADIGKQYGICKIVPPEGWNMPFVTDTASFRFKTRVQRLNQIEAAARAKLNFLEQLYRFHKQQGNSRMSIPTINQKPLDLWLLRREVKKMGGYETVCKQRSWGDLGRRLGYTGVPGLSTQLKNSYTRVILPFEHFLEHVRNSPTLSPSTNRSQNPQLKTHQNIQTSGRMGSVNSTGALGRTDHANSPPSSPLSNFSSPLSEPPEDAEGGVPRSDKRRTSQDRVVLENGLDGTPRARTSQSTLLPAATLEPGSQGRAGEICEICQKSNRGTEMLLCDGCDCGFHMFCLDPPLASIPRGQWFCHTCLFGTGEDFGFDEGEEHNLSSFQARDAAFRSLWFTRHPPAKPPSPDEWSTTIGDLVIPESHIEEEFWRLVQSPNDTVEIEYGADVHSTTHGSAMPTLEAHPNDPYSKDGWNLNNLAIASESLLRFIKSDISGMTVPWTYVGMVFSTFCWHNEDHYTYSINYMHWGETKTWYGIPGGDADIFEAAMRQEAPDLFEAQPDLLFQLVTLMNPSRLRKAGVKVFVCDQRAGEFVITFPKAYHAGFNHGLNFNEAVNFALPDWLPYDRDCVVRYQEHRKLPVFSHDELLITITQYSQTIKTALWLSPSLKEMRDRELSQRNTIRAQYPSLVESSEPDDRPEEQYQCSVCNTFCYLSQIVCKCGPKAACLEHADQLCSCGERVLTLRLRYTDAELSDICAKVEERALLPTSWEQKFQKALNETSKPLVRTLRALLAEGERINYCLPSLANLRKCVTRANDWVELANSIIARKQHRKRNRRSKIMRPTPKLSAEVADEALERPEKRLSDVYRLLDEVETLGFDAPEISGLRAVAAQAEDIRAKARSAYDAFQSSQEASLNIGECDNLVAEGSSLNIYLEEVYDLERVMLQHKLLQDIAEIDDSAITLEEVRSLLTRARACELPSDNKHLVALQKRQDAGDDWELKAARILEQPFKTIEELDEFDNPESLIPIDPAILDRLRIARAKAIEFERQANAWLHPEKGATLPKIQDVLRLAARAEKEFSIPALRELRRTADFAADLEHRCESVLKNRYHHKEETPIFDTMRDWDRYAKEHLNKFQLPNFEKLDEQLQAHDRWRERLPWFCTQHKDGHGQQVYDDVVASTDPENDCPPNDEYFTCICDEPVRPPAPGGLSDAVQCDHCFARFHGVCARRGGSCPFCDHHHWNGTLHKERAYHFCYMPTILLNAPELTKNYSLAWKQLETIVSRVDRLCQLVGAFLTYASQPANQRSELLPQVRHYMRKLFRIGFAIAPSPDVSYGLDLAGLHRILANQPPPPRPRKRRRPKFTFGQDIDTDWTDGTRCICRGKTAYLHNYRTVQCELCTRFYHSACVFYKFDARFPTNPAPRFLCPLCLLKKNRTYPNAEVRVRYIEDTDTNVYVDIRACLDKFSRELIRHTLPPAVSSTIFLDLVKFTPGSPDSGVLNGTSSRPETPPTRGVQTQPPPLSRVPPLPPWPVNERHGEDLVLYRGTKRRLSIEPDNTSTNASLKQATHTQPVNVPTTTNGSSTVNGRDGLNGSNGSNRLPIQTAHKSPPATGMNISTSSGGDSDIQHQSNPPSVPNAPPWSYKPGIPAQPEASISHKHAQRSRESWDGIQEIQSVGGKNGLSAEVSNKKPAKTSLSNSPLSHYSRHPIPEITGLQANPSRKAILPVDSSRPSPPGSQPTPQSSAAPGIRKIKLVVKNVPDREGQSSLRT